MDAPSSDLHVPAHVAIIMDGNGRWARRRGLPRAEGHRAGARAVRSTVEEARRLGVGTLTLYAFSSDNWQRPADEIGHLMRLFRRYLDEEGRRCAQNGIRLSVIGRRDRLEPGVLAAIERAEKTTESARDMHLRLAVDYSARQALAAAASLVRGGEAVTAESFATLIDRVTNCSVPTTDVDLLVRTSGEQRLSDFMLWECAYAEIVFTPVLWPDFGEVELRGAVEEFTRRERRFGAVVTTTG